MKTLYLGKWDNDEKKIQNVIEALRLEGRIAISFDYIGRTKHMTASQAMKRQLEKRIKNLRFKIGYNYEFIIECDNCHV